VVEHDLGVATSDAHVEVAVCPPRPAGEALEGDAACDPPRRRAVGELDARVADAHRHPRPETIVTHRHHSSRLAPHIDLRYDWTIYLPVGRLTP
jgi:hypothetical protein